MSKKSKKSGREVRKLRKQPLRIRAGEFFERVGDHFSDFFVSRLPNVRDVKLWVVEWSLLVLVVFLLAVVQIFWYGDAFQTEAYTKGGDYVEATIGKVNSLNPLYVSTGSERVLSKLLFANLVTIDESGHLKGELAESVKMSDDGLEWTVKMREGVYWSDGVEVNADDLMYTLDLIKDPDAKTTIASSLASIDVEKIDDYTVVFKLPSIYLNFKELLEFPIVPEHVLGEISPALIYESDFSLNPVVSGAFKLNTIQIGGSDKSLQTVYLSRNNNYFKGEAKLDSFTLKVYESDNDIVSALNDAEVNATAELDDSDGARVSRALKYRRALTNNGVYAFFNTSKGVVKEAKVRNAIAKGLDVTEILENEELQARRLYYPMLEEQGKGLDLPQKMIADKEEAKKALIDAGYKYNGDQLVDGENKKVSLKVVVQKRDEISQVAERFADGLRALGYDVNLVEYDESTGASFWNAVIVPRDYDILIHEVNLGVNLDLFTYYSSTQANEMGWNFSNYKNALADDALLSARTTLDSELRKAKYNSFLHYWEEDMPSIPLYQSVVNYYYSDNVEIFSESMHLTKANDRFQSVHNWAAKKKSVKLTP